MAHCQLLFSESCQTFFSLSGSNKTRHGLWFLGRSNVSAVIKTGAASAFVRVTLWNTGPDGFKPLIYGPKVTIERRIHRGGTSNVKIKDFHGVMVSVLR